MASQTDWLQVIVRIALGKPLKLKVSRAAWIVKRMECRCGLIVAHGCKS